MSSTQQVWLVTGVSTGIGNRLVYALLDAGHSVVATSRDPTSLEKELRSKYDSLVLENRVLALKLDLTDPEDVKAGFEKVVKKFARIDVVVNNAGYAVLSEAEGIALNDAHAQVDVMFWGAVYVTLEAVKVFRDINPKGSGGHVINISTIGGYFATPGVAFYCASKFAIEGFTESISKEVLPEWNIQFTIVQPGGFKTEWRGASMNIVPIHPAYDHPIGGTYQKRNLLKEIPFLGEPDRAATALIRLAERKNELPLRIQFGSDSFAMITSKAKRTITDAEQWADVAHSTNGDGINHEEYVEHLLLALGK